MLMAAANEATFSRLLESRGPGPSRDRSLALYRKLGRLFCPGHADGMDSGACFIEKLYQLSDALDLPRLSAFGIRREHLNAIAAEAANKNNPVHLSEEDIARLLLKRL